MAITPPSSYSVVQWQDLSGKVDLAKEPLHTILSNTNHLYGYHRPAVVNFCPHNDISTAGSTSYDFIVRAPLSADGLKYELDWYATHASNGGGQLEVFETTGAAAAGWGSAVITSAASWNGGQWNNATSSGAFSANATFLKFTYSAAVNGQVEAIILRPARVGSISTSTTYASGFIPYEDDLLAATGAPINTEFLNRACNNAAAVMADRQQVVFSFVNEDSELHRFSKSGPDTLIPVCMAQGNLPGQAGAILDIYVRGSDGGTGYIYVGEVGGEKVKLLADGTDRSGTITLTSESPVFTVDVVPDSGLDLTYVTIHWKPGRMS